MAELDARLASVSEVERRLAERLATLKDGADVTLDQVRPLVAEAVASAPFADAVKAIEARIEGLVPAARAEELAASLDAICEEMRGNAPEIGRADLDAIHASVAGIQDVVNEIAALRTEDSAAVAASVEEVRTALGGEIAVVRDALANLPAPEKVDVEAILEKAVAAAGEKAEALAADATTTAAEVRTALATEIAEVRALVGAIEIPAAVDLDGIINEVRAGDAEVAAAVAALREEVAAVPRLEPLPDISALVAEAVSEATADLHGAIKAVGSAPVLPNIPAIVAEAIAALPKPKDGKPGMLPLVKAWTDSVHYQGEAVTHDGATWQAVRDTGRAPPHEDWICLAKAGRDGEDGEDGRSFTVRGTWGDAVTYRALDVVALNGAAFVARKDEPGPCPGDGWQIIAMQGRPGKPGLRSTVEGPPGPAVVDMKVNGEGLLTLINADETKVTCDLYPLLSRLG